METIFEEMQDKKKREMISNRQETLYSVECSFIQLYNEQVEDLLSNKRKPLTIRENPQDGVYVEGLKKVSVSCKEELFHLVDKGFRKRVTASTALNDVSSRSHAIFRITVEQLIKIKDRLGNLSEESDCSNEKPELKGKEGCWIWWTWQGRKG